MNDLGTRENPFRLAPPEWDTEGVPYASFCECIKCGLVTTSTFSFDYYAEGPGEPLVCETCRTGYNVSEETQAALRDIGLQVKEEIENER